MLFIDKLLLGIIASICFIIYAIATYISYQRLRQFRGPWLAAISSSWNFWHTLKANQAVKISQAVQEYGPIARIGPNFLVTNRVDLMQRMNAPRSPYTRGNWYKGAQLEPGLDNVFSTRDEERHSYIRSKVANGYAGRNNPNLEDNIDARVMDLIECVQKNYLSVDGSYKVMDMARVSQFFTFDVLTTVAFSRDYGYLRANDDIHKYIEVSGTYLPIMDMSMNFTMVNWILSNPLLIAVLAAKDTDRFGLGKIMGLAKEVIRERYGPDAKDVNDMLGSFVRHGLTQQEVKGEALIQVLAGTDTTANALRTIFQYVTTNSRVHDILVKELLSAEISRPVIKNSEAKKLPYLQACITEGLRILPPAMGLFTKISPPEGDTLDDGTFIPGGVQIGYAAFAMHHDKKLYGEDAELFRPERWLEQKSEKLAEMQRNVDGVFGWGRSGCLGKTIALIELNKAISELFLRFEWAVLNPQKGFKSYTRGFHVQSDMFVTATPLKI